MPTVSLHKYDCRSAAKKAAPSPGRNLLHDAPAPAALKTTAAVKEDKKK